MQLDNLVRIIFSPVFNIPYFIFLLTREIWDGPVSGLDAAIDFFGASEVTHLSSFTSFDAL